MRILNRFSLLSALVIAGTSLSAQQSSAPPPASTPPAAQQTPASSKSVETITVDSHLVNVPAIVRDKKGVLVTTLSKDDFTLSEDGKPQTIRYFDRDNNLPLTLGLLVDVSQSQRNVIGQERDASYTFLDQMLTAKDQAFLIQFAREVDLLADPTSSRPKLQAALKQLFEPQFGNQGSGSSSTDSTDNSGNSGNSGGRGSGGRGGNGGGYGRGGGTQMYDAIYLASNEEMSKLKGRKALILLTDGVDNGSKETLADAIEAAQRADTMVYAIYYKGDEQRPANNGMNQGGRNRGGMGGGFPGGGYPGGGGGYPGGGGNRAPSQQARTDGKKVLLRITQETGGGLFEVSKKQDVDSIYKEIEAELRSQYRLGYTPTDLSNGYHRLQLTVKQSGYKVQTRDGYYIGQQ